GVNARPSTSVISGRTAKFSVPTPRTASARTEPLLRHVRFTAVTRSRVTAPRPSGVRDDSGRVQRQRALALEPSAVAQIDGSIRAADRDQRGRQAARHREHGHEHADDCRETDDHDDRRAEPLWKAPQAQQRDRDDLAKHGASSQRPARASTTFKRCARHVGNPELTAATANATTTPPMKVLFCIGIGATPIASNIVGNSTAATLRPTTAEVTHSNADSANTSEFTARLLKPYVFSTANSGTRSRIDCII